MDSSFAAVVGVSNQGGGCLPRAVTYTPSVQHAYTDAERGWSDNRKGIRGRLHVSVLWGDLAPAAGSVMPRPCPRCLETTGRAVEMVPNEPESRNPGPAEET